MFGAQDEEKQLLDDLRRMQEQLAAREEHRRLQNEAEKIEEFKKLIGTSTDPEWQDIYFKTEALMLELHKKPTVESERNPLLDCVGQLILQLENKPTPADIAAAKESMNLLRELQAIQQLIIEPQSSNTPVLVANRSTTLPKNLQPEALKQLHKAGCEIAADLIIHKATAPMRELSQALQCTSEMNKIATSVEDKYVSIRSKPAEYASALRTQQEKTQEHLEKARAGSPFIQAHKWDKLKTAFAVVALLVVIGAAAVLTHGAALPIALLVLDRMGNPPREKTPDSPSPRRPSSSAG